MTNIFIGLCLLPLFNPVISLLAFFCPLGIVSSSQANPTAVVKEIALPHF